MNTSKPKLPLRRKTIFVILGLLFIVLLAYLFAYKPYEVKKDRELFTRAEATTEEMYTKVEQLIGKPDEVVREKSCRYGSLKFAKGPLSCNTNIYLLYENHDAQSGSELMKKASALSGEKLRKGAGAKAEKIFIQDNSKVSQHIYQTYPHFYSSNKNQTCGVDYQYLVFANSFEIFTPRSSQSLKISVSCGGPAKAEHYPLKD